MQTLACRTDAQREALIASREHHHRRHLRFCKKDLHEFKLREHDVVILEQPRLALSWKTTALRTLPGYAAEFDQCRYGAQCLDVGGTWKPTQKPTRIQTTKKAVAEAMHLLYVNMIMNTAALKEVHQGLGSQNHLHGGLPTWFCGNLGCSNHAT